MEKASVHEKAGYLRDAVFAANDGIITTFAIVAGAAGASISPQVVVVLGLVNLLADGVSMSTGNYLGVKSELDYEVTKGNHDHGGHTPGRHAIITFSTFILAGFMPLIPYIFKFEPAFVISVILVAVSLFFVGASRSKITKKGFVRSGVEVFLVGGLATIIAYSVGYFAERYLL